MNIEYLVIPTKYSRVNFNGKTFRNIKTGPIKVYSIVDNDRVFYVHGVFSDTVNHGCRVSDEERDKVFKYFSKRKQLSIGEFGFMDEKKLIQVFQKYGGYLNDQSLLHRSHGLEFECGNIPVEFFGEANPSNFLIKKFIGSVQE